MGAGQREKDLNVALVEAREETVRLERQASAHAQARDELRRQLAAQAEANARQLAAQAEAHVPPMADLHCAKISLDAQAEVSGGAGGSGQAGGRRRGAWGGRGVGFKGGR